MVKLRDELRRVLSTHVISLKSEGQYIVDQLAGDYPNLLVLTAHTHKLKGLSGTAGFREIHDLTQILHECIMGRASFARPVDAECLKIAYRLQKRLNELTVDHSELLARSLA